MNVAAHPTRGSAARIEPEPATQATRRRLIETLGRPRLVLVAGYSGTPLAKKLGIDEEDQVALFEAPDRFEDVLAPVPAGVAIERSPSGQQDVLVLFCRDRATLEEHLGDRRAQMRPASGLWIGWPKKSSGVDTDLDQMRVMELVMEAHPELVDNKVCAIDETWSGLRFVIRTEHR